MVMECFQKRRNCAQDKALLDLMNKKYFTLRAQNMGISWEKVYIIFVSMMRYHTDINITLEDEGKILNVAGTKLRIPQILERGRYPQIMLSFCGGGRIGIQNFFWKIFWAAPWTPYICTQDIEYREALDEYKKVSLLQKKQAKKHNEFCSQ